VENEAEGTFSPALFNIGTVPKRFERGFNGIGELWVVSIKIKDLEIY
jgi:hypothetical protein